MTMKNVKISRRLEATIATMVFRLKRDGVVTSFVDRLVVELIADDETFASLLVSLMLGSGGKMAVCHDISELIESCHSVETELPELFFKQLCDRLYADAEAIRLSSAHVLCWALNMPDSATSKVFSECGIKAENVVELMCQLSNGSFNEKTLVE